MSTLVQQALDPLLDELELPPGDDAPIRAGLHGIGPNRCCRAVVTAPLPALVTRLRPQVLSAYETFSDRLGRPGPFSYAPFGHMVLRYLRAATLVYPRLPVLEAMDRLFTEAMLAFGDLPYAGVLTKTAENSPAKLLELSATIPDFFINFGERWYEPLEPQRGLLHFADFIPSSLAPYLAPGFFRGFVELTGYSADLTVDIHDAMRWTLDVSWHQPGA